MVYVSIVKSLSVCNLVSWDLSQHFCTMLRIGCFKVICLFSSLSLSPPCQRLPVVWNRMMMMTTTTMTMTILSSRHPVLHHPPPPPMMLPPSEDLIKPHAPPARTSRPPTRPSPAPISPAVGGRVRPQSAQRPGSARPGSASLRSLSSSQRSRSLTRPMSSTNRITTGSMVRYSQTCLSHHLFIKGKDQFRKRPPLKK